MQCLTENIPDIQEHLQQPHLFSVCAWTRVPDSLTTPLVKGSSQGKPLFPSQPPPSYSVISPVFNTVSPSSHHAELTEFEHCPYLSPVLEPNWAPYSSSNPNQYVSHHSREQMMSHHTLHHLNDSCWIVSPCSLTPNSKTSSKQRQYTPTSHPITHFHYSSSMWSHTSQSQPILSNLLQACVNIFSLLRSQSVHLIILEYLNGTSFMMYRWGPHLGYKQTPVNIHSTLRTDQSVSLIL